MATAKSHFAYLREAARLHYQQTLDDISALELRLSNSDRRQNVSTDTTLTIEPTLRTIATLDLHGSSKRAQVLKAIKDEPKTVKELRTELEMTSAQISGVVYSKPLKPFILCGVKNGLMTFKLRGEED